MASKVIILFESPNSSPPIADWDTIFGKMGRAGEVTLFWMSDSPYGTIVEALSKLKTKVNIIQPAPLLQREMQGFNYKIENWLRGLLRHFSDIPDFWLSRISEVNFANPIWFDMVRFSVFEAEFRAGKYVGCIAICGQNLNKLVSELCKEYGIRFFGQVNGSYRANWLQLSVFALGGWLKNFCTDMISLMLTRHTKRRSRAEVAVYARFPNNWSKASKASFYRFAGQISRNLSDLGKSGTYLVTVARRNQPGHKDVKTIISDYENLCSHTADMPVVSIEAFGKLADILVNYICIKDILKWFMRWLKLKRLGIIKWGKVDISFLFTGDIVNAALRDWPSNRYLVKCIGNAISDTGAKCLVVPIFELVEGRAVVRGGNLKGIKTIGVQHGSAGLAHRWRIMTITGIMASANGRKENIPSEVAVEGNCPARWLSNSGYPSNEIQKIGAPRLRKKVMEGKFNTKSRSIILLGDLHRPQELFMWALNNLGNKKYQLVFRPHPSSYNSTVKWLSSQQNKIKTNAYISRQGHALEDDLTRICPICIMVGCTGAAVDLALSGWPIIVILSNWLPDYSPMTGEKDNGILSSSQPEEVIQWLDMLENNYEYFTAYSRRCKDVAEELICKCGTVADKLLAKMI